MRYFLFCLLGCLNALALNVSVQGYHSLFRVPEVLMTVDGVQERVQLGETKNGVCALAAQGSQVMLHYDGTDHSFHLSCSSPNPPCPPDENKPVIKIDYSTQTEANPQEALRILLRRDPNETMSDEEYLRFLNLPNDFLPYITR